MRRILRPHHTLLPPIKVRSTTRWRRILAARTRKLIRQQPALPPLLGIALVFSSGFVLLALSTKSATPHLSIMFDEADQYALLLSLMAGLATSIGGLIAVWKKPDQKLLAFLLGTAIGVMATLSGVELYIKNVIENGFIGVTLSTGAGALLYVFLEPLLPKGELIEDKDDERKKEKEGGRADESSETGGAGAGAGADNKMSKARLMRLGLLMAITMTLHNLPEGFAVAFSSFTSIGPVMAIAIGVHNIPEGIIVAAPVYAATGSRRQALLMATASGLSEPAGALLALLFIKPYLTPLLLQYLLAGTGGVMSAVCVIELYPEGRKCRHDGQLLKGTLVGSAVMFGTLLLGV